MAKIFFSIHFMFFILVLPLATNEMEVTWHDEITDNELTTTHHHELQRIDLWNPWADALP